MIDGSLESDVPKGPCHILSAKVSLQKAVENSVMHALKCL